MLDQEQETEVVWQSLVARVSPRDVIAQLVARLPEDALVAWREALELRGVRCEGRRRLPPRRVVQTQHAMVCGLPLHLSVGFYADGTVGELFVDITKEGSAMRGLIHCFAILFSMALQYGVPLGVLVEQFAHVQFQPDGAVEGDEQITRATSVIDYVVRHLGVHVLGRQDLASSVPPKETSQ